MPRPHPALVHLAAGRAPGPIDDLDDGLLASAVDHGMQGLLWTWVRDHEPEYSERTTLAGADLVTRQRHGRLWDTLVKVRSDLADAGVEVATFKGVTAEARWYGRLGERPCTDLDVLLGPDASGRAAEVLDVLQPGHPLRGEIDSLVRSNVMQSVNVWVGGVSVDLHFDLLKIGIPTRQRDLVWQRTQGFPLPDGTAVGVPDAAMSLVSFLLHLNKDCFPRLLGFADVARILRDETLDWSFVEHFLHAEGLEVVAARALGTVTARLGLPMPRLGLANSPRARVWQTAWPDRVILLGSTGTSRSRRQDLIPFLARGRMGDAVRWSARIAFPPRATVAVSYPDIAGPYPWRLTRGRLRTAWARRGALRARRDPSVAAEPTPGRDPQVIVRLLRQRARSEPLWLDVRGRSMGWSIPDGARVRVEAATLPRRGEVWAFGNARGDIVVHRCRGATPDGHRFQGDASIRADDLVGPEMLIGRVVEQAPPQPRLRWSALAGAIQREPRLAIAASVRTMRRAGSPRAR